jgi:anti-sigma B factor antagonist
MSTNQVITNHGAAEAATITINGRFDAHQVPQVQQEMDGILAGGQHNIILNLADVNFVDSSALAVMVRGMKRCREQNGELILCGLRQPVRIIFELTRMDRAFRIYDDEAAAKRALKAGF